MSLAVQKKGVSLGVLKHAPKNQQASQAGQQQQQQQHQSITPKSTKIIKIFQRDSNSKESKIKLIQPQPMPQTVKPKEQVTPNKPKIQVQTLLAPKLTPPTPSPTIKTPKKETPKEPKVKTPKSKPKEEPQAPQAKQEDIRDMVQKTVCEQLIVRLKGSDVKLTDEEVKFSLYCDLILCPINHHFCR